MDRVIHRALWTELSEVESAAINGGESYYYSSEIVVMNGKEVKRLVRCSDPKNCIQISKINNIELEKLLSQFGGIFFIDV